MCFPFKHPHIACQSFNDRRVGGNYYYLKCSLCTYRKFFPEVAKDNTRNCNSMVTHGAVFFKFLLLMPFQEALWQWHLGVGILHPCLAALCEGKMHMFPPRQATFCSAVCSARQLCYLFLCENLSVYVPQCTLANLIIMLQC